jgi:hypothetical protein
VELLKKFSNLAGLALQSTAVEELVRRISKLETIYRLADVIALTKREA